MNRAVGHCSHAAVADVGENVARLRIVVVRVEVGVFVMLDAKVVPAHSQIERQAIRRFPGVLEIRAEFMITVAPSEDRWANRERHGTAGNSAGCATREFSLGIDGRLELPEYSVQEVFDAGAEIRCAEGFDSFLVGPKTPVVADVGVVAAEAEGVPSMDRAEILVSLDEVLWATEGDRIARCEGRISRHANEVSLNLGSRNGIHVQRGADRIGTERLKEIQSVENNLRLAGQLWVEGMN